MAKTPMKKKPDIKQILKDKSVVKLDIACGQNKQKGFVGMDMFPYPGVDVVHSALEFPWPFPDESVDMAVASHYLEHIPAFGIDTHLTQLIDLLISKKLITAKEVMDTMGEHKIFSNFIRFMDEVWRILKDGGQFAFVAPYYQSLGFAQDPTHVKMICEATMNYFDPEMHNRVFWNFYKPKPWKVELQTFQMTGNIEIIISKRNIKPYEKAIEGHLEK
jgi:SAM-dependent methyltransferase